MPLFGDEFKPIPRCKFTRSEFDDDENLRAVLEYIDRDEQGHVQFDDILTDECLRVTMADDEQGYADCSNTSQVVAVAIMRGIHERLIHMANREGSFVLMINEDRREAWS